jgi:hypothetical protein
MRFTYILLRFLFKVIRLRRLEGWSALRHLTVVIFSASGSFRPRTSILWRLEPHLYRQELGVTGSRGRTYVERFHLTSSISRVLAAILRPLIGEPGAVTVTVG